VIIKPIKIYLRKVFILLHVEAQGLDNLRRELSFLGIKPIIRNENLNQGHITLGVVKEESAERLEALSIFLEKVPIIISYINHIQADQMTIAHYRSRSFDKLLGAVVLGLGGKNGIDEEQFWRQLNLRE
jgi:hypothetical protein